MKLGKWISNIRSKRKHPGSNNMILDEERIRMLDEIVAIRESYGLSQVDLAKLLGWGEATISRYESKAIQDEAYLKINFLAYFDAFSVPTAEAVLKNI